MPDNRVKSVRIDVNLHGALKTLAGYLNRNIDDIISEGVTKLWAETFPKVPMPGAEGKKSRK